MCSARSVGVQNEREVLPVRALFEDRDAPVQMLTENGPGSRDGLSGESVLCGVDAATEVEHPQRPQVASSVAASMNPSQYFSVHCILFFVLFDADDGQHEQESNGV